MSAVGDARTRLYEAAKTAVAAPWRVFEVSPAQITAPAVWIDSVELGTDAVDTAGIIVATFPVYVVVDGTVRSQIAALDELVSSLWTVVSNDGGGDPISCRPINLDAGGVNLRAQVMRVDVLLAARTFCAPALSSTGGNP